MPCSFGSRRRVTWKFRECGWTSASSHRGGKTSAEISWQSGQESQYTCVSSGSISQFKEESADPCFISNKSTVMLTVNVSFLAVPSVNIQQSQSLGIISTYLSTIFITGSLIASLLLAGQIERYGPESAVGAVYPQTTVYLCNANLSCQTRLLSKMTGIFFGARALSMIHSLPFAMLLWG